MVKSRSFWNSSLGKKHLMAISGLAWCGFVLTHMAGNLLALVGADAYNLYGHKIITMPILPLAEAGLVITLLLHVVSALRVTLGNMAARPEKYAVSPQVKGKASIAAKTMALSGTLILTFLILHLITFKYGPHYPSVVDGVEVRDLYRLMHEVFVQPLYIGWYVFSMLVLYLHLQHALYSSIQTLGFVPPACERSLLAASHAFGALIAVGFIIGPILLFIRG